MVATDPNRRCTCGYRIFRDVRIRASQTVTRWAEVSDPEVGYGATPYGTYFGAGEDADGWASFEVVLREIDLVTRCESCGRQRSSQVLGSFALLAGYVEQGYFYLVGSDFEGLGCLSLRYTGASRQFEEPLYLVVAEPPPIQADPEEVVDELPEGAEVVDTVLRARLPEVDVTEDYVVELVNRCYGVTLPVATITLEAPAMLIRPTDADIGGAPREWLTDSRAKLPVGQPAGAPQPTIPFDYNVAVLEYDARFGTKPDEQGWSFEGNGSDTDYQLVEGGALRASTEDTSLWSQEVELDDPSEQVHGYAYVLGDEIPVGGDAEGLVLVALQTESGENPEGFKVALGDSGLRSIELTDAGTELIVESLPRGWLTLGGSDHVDGEEIMWTSWRPYTSAAYGAISSPAGSTAITCAWGDIEGAGLTAFIRNVVVSSPGRWIRAYFTAFAPVNTPKLRLYMTADANSSVTKTARFVVRYGLATSDPYEIPTTESSFTVNFPVAGTVIETSLDLGGLTANRPFWWTLERVAGDDDDQLEATAHFLYATVRSV